MSTRIATLVVVPSLVCAPIGGVFGAVHGYNSSRKRDFFTNVLSTTGGIVYGALGGAILGGLWPITLSVALLRTSHK